MSRHLICAGLLFAVFGASYIFGEPLPERQVRRLKSWLVSPDQQLRLDAVAELSRSQNPEALSLLLSARGDIAAEVRATIAWNLGSFKDARAVAGLHEMLGDKDEHVRAGAVWAISHIGGKPVFSDVARLAKEDPSGVVRFRAVWGLAFIGDKAAVPVAITALEDYVPSVRERSALLVLETLADKSVATQLVNKAWSVNPAARRIVMYLLARYGDQTVWPTLQAGLYDVDPLVRGEAALSLGKMRAHPAVPALVHVLRDDDEHVRGSAAYALGLMGEKTAADSLRPLLEDRAAFVRAIAAESLQMLGDKTVKPPEGFRAAELFTYPIHNAPDHPELYR